MRVKKSKKRLDESLLSEGLAGSLTEARALIMAGQVLVDEQRIDKPGALVGEGAQLRLKGHKRFVSRGGEKLWAALEDLQLFSIFNGAVVLDCGASTGGFTDCALQAGAAKVYALDVGFNQLAWKLRTDRRIVMMEQTDIRDLDGPLDPGLSIVMVDISFNSLDRLLPAIVRAVPQAGVHFLLLVKPQFELDKEEVPSGGVVAASESQQQALDQAFQAVHREGLQLQASLPSRVLGREGNQEFFIYATRRP